MSSHHIVRENQEPVLLIAATEGISRPAMDDLLEWSPQVWVCESALQEVLRWNIKIDMAIVSESSQNAWVKALQHQLPVKILTHGAAEPPWVTAFFLLRSLGLSDIQISGVNPADIGLIPEGLHVCCMSSGMRWVYVRSGVYEKWMPAGTPVHYVGDNVHAAGVGAQGVTEKDGLVRLTSATAFWAGEILITPFGP